MRAAGILRNGPGPLLRVPGWSFEYALILTVLKSHHCRRRSTSRLHPWGSAAKRGGSDKRSTPGRRLTLPACAPGVSPSKPIARRVGALNPPWWESSRRSATPAPGKATHDVPIIKAPPSGPSWMPKATTPPRPYGPPRPKSSRCSTQRPWPRAVLRTATRRECRGSAGKNGAAGGVGPAETLEALAPASR